MENRPIDYVLGFLLLALAVTVRLLTPLGPTGDLLLVALIVLAWFVDGLLLLVLLGVGAVWLSLFPGTTDAIAYTVLFPLAVFGARSQGLLARWRPWLANVVSVIVGVLGFHALIHPRIFADAPAALIQGTAYALLSGLVLFGILREIYVRKTR